MRLTREETLGVTSLEGRASGRTRTDRRGRASLLAVCVIASSPTLACATPRTPGPTTQEAARTLRAVPADLAAAEAAWRAHPQSLDALVWYGRRLAYEGRFEEAVAIYGEGLRRHPGEPELLRHRGHRLLSLRRFEEARADLGQAAAALEGTPDRVELDGLPNAYDVPRGTLHTNVWYHLGLACAFLGRDEEAARAFARCLAVATNDDFRVAAAYWRVLALHHLGAVKEARALAELHAGFELQLMESFDYAALLGLFAGTSQAALESLAAAETPLASATLAYGVAMWHALNGRASENRAALMALVAAEPSSAFGRLAAEVELARLEGARVEVRP